MENDVPTAKMVALGKEIYYIKQRIDKLPNYNRNGLEKLSRFLGRAGA